MAIITIRGEAEFEEKVMKVQLPVLVDFWAPWCGPCKMVAPELEAMAPDVEGKAVIAKVNVDENQSLAGRFNIMGIPTLLIIKGGKEVERIVGFRPKQELLAALNKVM